MESKKEFSLEELAELTGSTILGNPFYKISGYADLDSATEREISFLSKPRYTSTRYVNAMKKTHAGAIFIADAVDAPEDKNYLLNEDPSKAFQIAVELLNSTSCASSFFSSIHPSAVIHETAAIGANASIGPHAVIDAEVSIGDNCFIGAGAYIGPHTSVGSDCIIYPNATIRENCRLGNRVHIQSGTVIGSCGFGFSTDKHGVHTRISQIGVVIIEDDVEIGSNCIVDRARFTETRIGKGTKIDSLVIVGHNVKLGKHNLICGQTAFAGSAKTGDHVVIAGQCGIDGHISLENRVMVIARSGITKSLKSGKYGGFPAQPLDKFNRNNVLVHNLETFVSKIKSLEALCKSLEEKIQEKEP